MSVHSGETKNDTQRINSAHMKTLDFHLNQNSLTVQPSKQNLQSEIIKAPCKTSIQDNSPGDSLHHAHKCLVKHHKVKPQIRSEQISAN